MAPDLSRTMKPIDQWVEEQLALAPTPTPEQLDNLARLLGIEEYEAPPTGGYEDHSHAA